MTVSAPTENGRTVPHEAPALDDRLPCFGSAFADRLRGRMTEGGDGE